MKPIDLTAQLTPCELQAVRSAVADVTRREPVWTQEAATSAAQMIEVGDGDDSRGMKFGVAVALALKGLRQ